MSSTSAVLIYEFDEETSTVLATTSSSPCQSRFEIFKDMGDVWLLFVSIVPSLTSLSRSTSVFVFGYGLAVALKVKGVVKRVQIYRAKGPLDYNLKMHIKCLGKSLK